MTYSKDLIAFYIFYQNTPIRNYQIFVYVLY